MKNKIYGIFSFSSSNYAMASEQVSATLDEARLIPVPPEISAGCGLALRVNENNIEQCKSYLKENNIPFEKIHRLEIIDRKRIVSEL